MLDYIFDYMSSTYDDSILLAKKRLSDLQLSGLQPFKKFLLVTVILKGSKTSGRAKIVKYFSAITKLQKSYCNCLVRVQRMFNICAVIKSLLHIFFKYNSYPSCGGDISAFFGAGGMK